MAQPLETPVSRSDAAVWERLAPGELSAQIHSARPPLVLDLRSPEDFLGEDGHIDGASLFPFEQLEESLAELRGLEARTFVLVCEDERLSRRAAQMLLDAGFAPPKVLAGGMKAWSAEGLPVR